MEHHARLGNQPRYSSLIWLSALFAVSIAATPARAQVSTPADFPLALGSVRDSFGLILPGGNLTICAQPYALCAASTCTPIPNATVTNSAGETFPAASCLCPILPGPALADVNAGNMNGKDCSPPADGGVWSLFWLNLTIPQETAKGIWRKLPAIPQNCPGSSNDGQIVNCFSWSCTRAGKMNGVAVAQCTCPIQPVPGDTFAIQSGLCNQSACDEFPVAAPITVPNLCSDLPEGKK
jgi:hypothetical protein